MRPRHWFGLVALLTAAVAAGVFLTAPGDTGSTYYLDVDPVEATPSAAETVAYADLTPDQRRSFDRARNTTEMVELPASVDHEVFIDHSRVRYENRSYAVAVAVSG